MLRLAGDALISLATPVVFATVAALILSRQPRNTIGWVLMVPVGAFVVGTPLENYVEYLAPSAPEPTVPLLLMVWFGGEKVVARVSWSGAHQGEFMGIAPTGNRVEVSGIDILRIAEGKIVEHWGNFDDLGMMQQLGIIEQPSG